MTYRNSSYRERSNRRGLPTTTPDTRKVLQGTTWFRSLPLCLFAIALVIGTTDDAAAAGKVRNGRSLANQTVAGGIEGPKRTIMVAGFTALARFDHEQGGPSEIGGGLSAMLTTALHESGRFLVVERPQIEAVMKEQQLSINQLVNVESRSLPGAFIGAQWLITGHVTEFSSSNKGGGAGIGAAVGGGVIGISPKKGVGTVGLDIRVIDTTTGAVVSSTSVNESITTRSIGLRASYGDIDLESSRFARTPLGKASRTAIEKVVDHLSRSLAATPWSGRIVEFDSGEVVLNAGSKAGIEIGQALQVRRRTKALTDPVTGELLGYRERQLGTATVIDVQERIAFARFTAADDSAVPTRNDLVTLLDR